MAGLIHYRSESGLYLGATDGDPPEGGTPCPPPQDARQIWDVDAHAWGPLPLSNPLTEPLSRLAFWLAAAEIGVTKAGIRAHIEVMPDGVEKFQALAYLEEAQVYRREDPLLIQMAAVEGITEPELDALWTWAAQAYP